MIGTSSALNENHMAFRVSVPIYTTSFIMKLKVLITCNLMLYYSIAHGQ